MKLPQISGKDLIKKLMCLGFVVVRQRGSHIRLEKNIGETTRKITVPNHSLIKKGTLNRIIKDLNLDEKDIF
jgi:predicted RNA binding protein YcfA (HicA-like mRNA interferase family)